MKSMIRKQTLQHLKMKDFATYEAQSQVLCDKLFSYIKSYQTVAITIAAFPEVNTRAIIEKMWQNNIRVCVPKCDAQTKTMQFHQIHSFNELEQVYMHLYEPIPSQTDVINSVNIECIVVPGVAFNEQGYRIGFGGGYYDRYLANYRGATISMIFDEQFVTQIPIDAYDLPIDQCVMINKVIDCKGKRKEV